MGHATRDSSEGKHYPGRSIVSPAGLERRLRGISRQVARMLVYGALSFAQANRPSAFEMPVLCTEADYSAAAVQGWYSSIGRSDTARLTVAPSLSRSSTVWRPARCVSRPRNVIGHRTLRMPCATRMGHRAKASHCLILAAGLQNKGSCCGPIRRTLKAESFK